MSSPAPDDMTKNGGGNPMDHDAQSRGPTSLVAQLMDPGAYSQAARSVQFLDTHISQVFLVGRHAYKVKKPVNFGFVDYSSLELRRQWCEEEVRLNSRLSPDVYLGVVPIVETPDGLRVGGEGKPIEYAVAMRRLPQARMLDRLVRSGEVTEAIIERIAARVAAFHEEAEQRPDIDQFGAPGLIGYNWRENFEQMLPYIGRTISKRQFEEITAYVNQFLVSSIDLLLDRVENGRIRDCHGDMRAESICVENGLSIFDCIEFNDRFRYGDVAAEVAFLAMDLDILGRPDLGYWFADRYIALTGDQSMRRLLPFYQCYRAFVRGKVLSFRLDDPTQSERERRTVSRRARRYARLCASYAGVPKETAIVVVCGLPGTGKTTLARGLAGRLGGVVFSSDRVRKEIMGLAPSVRAASEFQHGIYAPDTSHQTYARLIELGRAAVASGTTVILDATFREADDQKLVMDLAAKLGMACWFLECVCPDELVRRRLDQRVKRDEGASDADWSVYLQQRAGLEPIRLAESVRHLVLDTSVRLPELVERTLKRMH